MLSLLKCCNLIKVSITMNVHKALQDHVPSLRLVRQLPSASESISSLIRCSDPGRVAAPGWSSGGGLGSGPRPNMGRVEIPRVAARP